MKKFVRVLFLGILLSYNSIDARRWQSYGFFAVFYLFPAYVIYTRHPFPAGAERSDFETYLRACGFMTAMSGFLDCVMRCLSCCEDQLDPYNPRTYYTMHELAVGPTIANISLDIHDALRYWESRGYSTQHLIQILNQPYSRRHEIYGTFFSEIYKIAEILGLSQEETRAVINMFPGKMQEFEALLQYLVNQKNQRFLPAPVPTSMAHDKQD